MLELFPPVIRIRLLEAVALQHHGQHGAELLGLVAVTLLPRQHVRLRVIVHGVGVLVGNAVEEPARGRRRLETRALVLGELGAHDLPVPDLVPLLILDEPLLQIGLAALVLPEGVRGLLYLFGADAPLRRRYAEQLRHVRRRPLHARHAASARRHPCPAHRRNCRLSVLQARRLRLLRGHGVYVLFRPPFENSHYPSLL